MALMHFLQPGIMEFSPNHDGISLLILSTCQEQLETVRVWLDHHKDELFLPAHFLLMDEDHQWQTHELITGENLPWQAAVVIVDSLCDQRRHWLQELQQAVPTILISSKDHYNQLPYAFQWLSLSDVDRTRLFRSLRPLHLSLRDDLPPTLERNDFLSQLRQRLSAAPRPLYLQVIQCRWLQDAQRSGWRHLQSVQREFERSIRLRAPETSLVGRILDDQLIIASDNYYDLQADWLPHHPDDDLRPWIVYHSAPLQLEDISSLSAVLQEGIQQIARERLIQEAQFEWRTHERSLSLFDGLHLALQREEFYLESQPQFDSHSGSWVGAEALMRWRHPSLGVIPPTVFIREAEAAGLIQALGQWALRETAATWKRIREQTGESVRLAVNVSFPEVADPWYAEQVMEILNQAGMPPQFLELELTETAMMQDASVSMLNLRHLKAQGIHIVLDDFGTGFSSLSHLSDLPLTGIKLDRAFVSPLPDNGPQTHIVTSMLELAKRLNLETTAEGVEDIACLELVRKLGCDRIQGYIYAQPLALGELISRAREGFRPPQDFQQGSLF